jgi:hypothetical protein
MEQVTRTALHGHIEPDEAFYTVYEGYVPDAETLAAVRTARPAAHVVVASRYTCPDCLRHVPRMARLAEHLPGWTWEVFESNVDPERRAALNISRIPTFIVYDRQDGVELGRIVENPLTGALERDLLAIVAAP